ncbi:MAG TPA: amylo-alpha-1,6-glucosidase [Vicinamibacterales bacterium]|nr:amylo-alpha-1,6-glucosidase [Vicinamibacterales bacterium]
MTIAAAEWLEADGLGGFASGTSTLVRTRRYHGLLLPALTPPTSRVMLVNGLEAWVDAPSGRFAISTQRYAPDVVHPDGLGRLVSFTQDPWPSWIFRLEDGSELVQELFAVHGAPVTAISWRLSEPRPGVVLSVRPLLSGRDYHSIHHENSAFRFDAHVAGERTTWSPYDGLPGVTAVSNGRYAHAPDWYRNFLYEEERIRGLDCVEDLASPGVLTWDLSTPAVLLLTTDARAVNGRAEQAFEELRQREARRRVYPSILHRAADAYLVSRGMGRTIVAGYPWFTDWGRDTFISIRGLCLATGRLEVARDILMAWSGAVSEGMLPNRFPDRGDVPEFNSVDASLWYIVAVGEFLNACRDRGVQLTEHEESALKRAVDAILTGYAAGTRYGIRLDDDGLLACGRTDAQLTWMDAKIGDWVVTPRTGKPVEIQALWLNALDVAGAWSDRWTADLEKGTRAFAQRFWNPSDGCLYDVVDVDHRRGTVDASVRPNQILAVGGLPRMLLDRERARRVVDAVEARLVTPMGLRSLAPGSPAYASRYEGSPAERDARYHQGTVWPWLIGPFVEAWLRVHGPTARTRREARERFLAPLLELAARSGGHLPEIADADPPHTPRGCPAQAWSVAEVLRVSLQFSAPGSGRRKARPGSGLALTY